MVECNKGRPPMIGSPEVNKVIRRVLSPVLRKNGFSEVQTRKNWGFHRPVTWVLEIRAVGSYFSDVTGWPPMSVCVWLGAFYDFCPKEFARPPKTNPEGRLLPAEFQCHRRDHLRRDLDQRRFTLELLNPAERSRTDIWWIERDGSNVEDAVEDIARNFLAQGPPWFERMSDMESVYAEIRQGRDCRNKFEQAAGFAKRLGREQEYEQYRGLLEEETKRLGRQR